MPRQEQKRALPRVTYEQMRKGEQGCAESGDVLSLLFHCRFFFVARIIPPISVVNDFLTGAAEDQSKSGGECRWKPLQLDALDYRNFILALRRKRFKEIASPRWVRTHRDWQIWCGEVVWGVPALKRRRLDKKIAALERALDQPGISNDRVVKQLQKLMDLRMEDARYFSQNSSQKPKLPLFNGR